MHILYLISYWSNKNCFLMNMVLKVYIVKEMYEKCEDNQK